MKIKQAVILAGGQGVRLRPLTDDIPKPLAPINGIPFLDYLLESVAEAGIPKVLVLVGYKYDRIVKRYGNKLGNGMVVEYSIGTEEDQTGRRVLNAFPQLDEHFLLMYGDNYWRIRISGMLDVYRRTNARVLTTVFANKHGTGEYGRENNVTVDSESFLTCYDRTRTRAGLNGVDIGYFIIARRALDHGLAGNLSLEQDMLTGWIEQRKVAAYITDEQYYYITDMKSLRRFEEFAAINKLHRILI